MIGVLHEGELQKKAKGSMISYWHPRYWVLTEVVPRTAAVAAAKGGNGGDCEEEREEQVLLYYADARERGRVPKGVVPIADVTRIERVQGTSKKTRDRRLNIHVSHDSHSSVFQLLAADADTCVGWITALEGAVRRRHAVAPSASSGRLSSSTSAWKLNENEARVCPWVDIRLVSSDTLRRAMTAPDLEHPYGASSSPLHRSHTSPAISLPPISDEQQEEERKDKTKGEERAQEKEEEKEEEEEEEEDEDQEKKEDEEEEEKATLCAKSDSASEEGRKEEEKKEPEHVDVQVDMKEEEKKEKKKEKEKNAQAATAQEEEEEAATVAAAEAAKETEKQKKKEKKDSKCFCF